MRVGIDLGTTNCTVGRIRADGRRSVLGPIPSIGAWKNGEVLFGDEARQMLLSEDTAVHPIRDLKLALGLSDVRIGQRRHDSVELAAQLLGSVVSRIGDPQDVEEAVIATPVSMPLPHREALRRAADLAGLRSVRLVYEPTAALIGAARFEHVHGHDLVLVVDWGGGTLDLSVVRADGHAYQELAVGGDLNSLGGTRIDEEITREVIRADPELQKRLDSIEGGFERLKDEIEEQKKEILEDLDFDDSEERMFAPHWLGEIVILSPDLVFRTMDEFADRAAFQILDSLRRGGVAGDDITHVLFAGGVCQSESVRERIRSRFPYAVEIAVSAPQKLTGEGCTELTETPFSLELGAGFGLRQCDASVCVLLPKGLLVTELDAVRQAEFLVTDPSAPEAVLDLGIVPDSGVGEISLDRNASGFVSLRQLFVPVGRASEGVREPVLDRVKLLAGVDANLMVKVAALSSLADARCEEHVPGVPLAIRLMGQQERA